MGLLAPTATVAQSPGAHQIFRSIWADHADAISTQYSGTSALKTDLTRTGRRTTMGVIKDVINSARRYILNNFYDGSRQDAMDLFFGAYQVGMNPNIRVKDTEETLLFYLAPLILMVSLLYLLLFPSRLTALLSKPFEIVAAILLAVLSAMYVYHNGAQYVQYPRLNRPEFLVEHLPIQP